MAAAPRVGVVVDSTADLDAGEARAAGMTVVPLFVSFGDERYRDQVDLSREAFAAKLAAARTLPTTSQPTPAMFEQAFAPHVDAGRAIVCLTIMAALSGTINAAAAAAKAFPGAPIALHDSGTVAGGLALQALHAADLARAGADLDAIVAALAYDRETLRGYATVPDLTHAVRTGRVSRAQAFLGSALKIVPVLRLDSGKIAEHARVRTFDRAIATMVEAAAADADRADGAAIAVIHAAAPQTAERVRAALAAAIRRTPARWLLHEAGPVLATHAGAGAVGIFVLPGTS